MAAVRCSSCKSLNSSQNATCKKCGTSLPVASLPEVTPITAAPAPAVAKVKEPIAPRPCPECAEITAGTRCEHCGYGFRKKAPCAECGEVTERQVCEFCGHNPREALRARGAAAASKGGVGALEVLGGVARGVAPAVGGIAGIATANALPKNSAPDPSPKKKRRKP